MNDRLKQLQEQKAQCDIRNKNQRIAMSNLKNKYETLNKDIDELIKKYRKEINKCDCDTCRACQTYHKVIQDLKSLKGE